MTSKLYDAYKTDKDAEQNGVWTDPEAGVSFKLARMGGANSKYQRALAQAMKPHMREAQLGLLEESVADPIMQKVFIETVLLGWKSYDDEGKEKDGVIDGPDGQPLSFSKDNAKKLFSDLPDLYMRLREYASSYANFRSAVLAEASKN